MQVDVALYQRMAAYNAWMTEKSYQAAAKMSDKERRQDRGAFFRSVHSTLNHILFGDRAWMNRFWVKTYDIKGMGVDIYEDFSELKAAHLEISRDIVTFSGGLSTEWLSEVMEWKSTTDGTSRKRPRWLLIMHMFNHQTHHRGQLSALFTQAGLDIGVTDLPFMPDLIEEFAG
ncbi:MAG: DinB family protein [Pseudomonadota bacterium]